MLNNFNIISQLKNEISLYRTGLISLTESLEFITPHVNSETLETIRNAILDRADKLVKNPSSGRREEYVEHLGLNHRRIIESHYKIIYRIIGKTIYNRHLRQPTSP